MRPFPPAAFLCTRSSRKGGRDMAVLIESSYGKTIGLPGYSSHRFNLSIKTEVTDLSQIGEEATRIYQLLQEAVDQQMVHAGWVPQGTNDHTVQNGNGGHTQGEHDRSTEAWNCSEK